MDQDIMAADLRELRALVDEQAQDAALWITLSGVPNRAHLQAELRRLHAAIEHATRWVEAE